MKVLPEVCRAMSEKAKQHVHPYSPVPHPGQTLLINHSTFFSLSTGVTLGSFSPWYNMRGATAWQWKSTWPLCKGFIVKIVENGRDTSIVSAFVNSGGWCILRELSRERNMEGNWYPPPPPSAVVAKAGSQGGHPGLATPPWFYEDISL